MKERNLLEKLIQTPSPSGFEVNIQKLLINELKDVDDIYITQNNSNVIHVLNEKSPTKILLCAHCDEVGMIINKVRSDGTLQLEQIGGSRPYTYIGQHVLILNKDKLVPGVIGYLPNMDKGITTNDLILDIGTSSKEESLKLVEVGNPVIVNRDFTYLNDKKLAARALDDKLAIYIFSEVLKNVKGKTDKGIYFSSTVGEETTGRGAKSAVEKVKPTCAIIIDVTYATDIMYRERLNADISLGKGPVLTVGAVLNNKMHERFKDICKNLNISYQTEVAPERTYTDSDSVYVNGEGVPTYLISIPLRYMHSSVEVCDFKDVDEIIDIVTEFILSMEDNFNFNPFLD